MRACMSAMGEWIGARAVTPDATVVDAAGKWITPGLIHVHSHLSVYPSPGVAAHSDGRWHRRPIGHDAESADKAIAALSI